MQLLIQLNEYEVRYLLAWGFGEDAPADSGATGDFGIWLDATPENISKLLSLLINMGYDPDDVLRLRVVDFFEPYLLTLHLPSNLVVDFLTAAFGFDCGDFEECYRTAAVVQLDEMSFRMLERPAMLPVQVGSENGGVEEVLKAAVVIKQRHKI